MAATRKKSSGRRTARRRSKKQKQQALLASMGLFALGILQIVLLFVKGSVGWNAVRAALFGAFGVSFWLMGALLLYFAVRTAQNKPTGADAAKAVLGLLILSGTSAIFSKMDAAMPLNLDALKTYYANGQAGAAGSGVLGLPVGWLLLHFCGRPAANIIIIVLILCALMIIFGISPAEVWAFVSYHGGNLADTQRQALQDTEEGYRRRREARNAAHPLPAEEPAPEEEEQTELREPNRFFAAVGGFFANLFGGRGEEALTDDPDAEGQEPASRILSNRRSVMETALRNSSRTAIDIDLGPEKAAVPTGTSEPMEPVVIGPGGTFGQNPLEQNEAAPAAPMDPFSTPAPEPQVILPPAGSAADTADRERPQTAAGGAAAAAVPQQTPGPAALQPDPPAAEEDVGWISLAAEPDVPADSHAIEHLTAAALDKPKAAEQAAAAQPVPQAAQPAAYCYPPLDLFEKPRENQDPNAFFAQHAARLGAGIVEFCGLPDDNRAGADDHDGFDIGALRHWRFPPWRNA